MRHIHLILEVHCLYGINEKQEQNTIAKCKYGHINLGYHCLESECEFAAYADAPYEIAYAGKNGEVAHDAWIGFGGDMEPENIDSDKLCTLKKSWEKICKAKIDDAYEEYMEKSELPKS